VSHALILSCAIAAGLALSALPVAAQTALTRMPISTFSAPLEITVARELGIFERNGLSIENTAAQGSIPQLQGLLDQEYGIVSTSADNLVYWDEDRGADFIVLMMGAGELDQSLFVRPEITSFADLRGHTLAVDSADSGYSTVLRVMLQRNGLTVGEDVQLQEVGNTGLRTQSVLSGDTVGSMLGENQTSFIDQATAGGVHMLARGAEYVPQYPSATYATTRRWAADNPQLVVAFLRSLREAREWIRNPVHADQAREIVMRNDRVNEEVARRTYQNALSDIGAPTPENQNRVDMIQMIVDLRIEAGLMTPPAPPASKYMAPGWYLLSDQLSR